MQRQCLLPILLAVVCGSPVSALAAEWGDLRIRFVYAGEPPTPAKIQPTKDEGFCGQHELIDESLLVHPQNRGVANVIVYAYTHRRGGAGTPLPAIHPSLEGMTQTHQLTTRNCRFEPHILIMQRGDELLATPADPVGHNANFNFFKNSPVGLTVPVGSEQRRTIHEAEPAPIPVECNIHPWMKAYILVVDHRYAAVTDADGNLLIENLPAGQKLTFRIWHESFARGTAIQGVQVGAGKINRLRLVDLEIAAGMNDLGEVLLPEAAFARPAASATP